VILKPHAAHPHADLNAWPRGFAWLIGAQFTSALADNALLIVTIALLELQGLPGWWAPLLKLSFTLWYVLFAPLVGPLADAFAKGRVMAAMNGVKIIGVLALALGLNPVAAFAIVGLGAAGYAPAKYGLVTELVGPERLVPANAWLEMSVVSAVLMGAVLGGVLISPALLATGAWADVGQVVLFMQAGALNASLLAVLLLYLVASGLNWAVPHSGARYPLADVAPAALWRNFGHANRVLWRDRQGGLAMAATTVFWGAGATLQFVVLRWGVEHLGLTLERAAYLQAAVAVGVMVGAGVAGRWVVLRHAPHMLWAGVLLGVAMPLVGGVQHLGLAVLGLAALGALGGAMVVPLNALLQHRGHSLLTAGRSIAVQGFNENAGVLAMLALYAAAQAGGLGILTTMWLLGLGVAGAVLALLWRWRGQMVEATTVASENWQARR
jgi:MFS transporter, LPLT family, lysophospholipid transporter